MNSIYILTYLASTIPLVYLVLWFVRKRKRIQTQLRLLKGRRHILDEEISAQAASIQATDSSNRLDIISEQANNALDILNVALVERQAHLLNYADLAHLQEYKIRLYEGDINNSSTSPVSGSFDTNEKSAASPPVKDPNDTADEEAPKNRDQIENQLLEKISQINKK